VKHVAQKLKSGLISRILFWECHPESKDGTLVKSFSNKKDSIPNTDDLKMRKDNYA